MEDKLKIEVGDTVELGQPIPSIHGGNLFPAPRGKVTAIYKTGCVYIAPENGGKRKALNISELTLLSKAD